MTDRNFGFEYYRVASLINRAPGPTSPGLAPARGQAGFAQFQGLTSVKVPPPTATLLPLPVTA
jgi:hypothetical protein